MMSFEIFYCLCLCVAGLTPVVITSHWYSDSLIKQDNGQDIAKNDFSSQIFIFFTVIPYLAIFMLLLGVTSLPLFSMLLTTSLFLGVFGVSIAKQAILKEPLVFQDFFLAKQVVDHPGLYIGYLGYTRFFAFIGLITVIIGIMFMQEHGLLISLYTRLSLGIFSLICIGITIAYTYLEVKYFKKLSLPPLELEHNISVYGLYAVLWLTGMNVRLNRKQDVYKKSPNWVFSDQKPSSDKCPHIVLIQAESFIAPERILENQSDIEKCMPTWASLKQDNLSGYFDVPAWGANTMRTEFSVLTGKDNKNLGHHRYNPFLSMPEKKTDIWSLPHFLKSEHGYSNYTIHPFSGRFFDRHNTYPKLGFDEFIDEAAFKYASQRGQHVADHEIATYTINKLHQSTGPAFSFLITMEGHGPWGKDRLCSEERSDPAYKDFALLPEPLRQYVYHLNGLDQMLAIFKDNSKNLDRPLILAVYGDHPPMLELQNHNTSENKKHMTNYLIYTAGIRYPKDKYVHETLESGQIGLILASLSGFVK